MEQVFNMEKVFTLSHKVIVPTDFTGFVSLSDMEKTAILFDLMVTTNKLEALARCYDKEIDLLHEEIKALKSAYRPQERGTEPAPVASSPNTEDRIEIIVDEPSNSDGSTLNKKLGKTSKYHYINAQNRNGKFQSFRANTTINGKSAGMGSSADEIKCALMADAYLDKIGDNKRKRNRDEFPEVREAFIAKVEGEKVLAKVAGAKAAGGSK
jgi:hypothetical protein